MMQIIKDYPPIYQAIIDAGMNPHEGVIYTYGDAIYNPNGIELPDHLIKHEETHSRQQRSDVDAWWGRYLIDPYFRIDQEVEAYAVQYKFICQTMKDRNQRARVLTDFARTLSGPLYGNIIGHQAAFKMIKSN